MWNVLKSSEEEIIPPQASENSVIVFFWTRNWKLLKRGAINFYAGDYPTDCASFLFANFEDRR